MQHIGLGSLVQVLERRCSRLMCTFYQITSEAKSIEAKDKTQGLLREIGARRYYLPERMENGGQTRSEIQQQLLD